jgi:uncharacterized protein
MKIDGFIWLEQFLEKVAVKHAMTVEEVQQVFWNRPDIRQMERGKLPGENVYRALGQTNEGRYVMVIFIYKPQLRRALIISARDMDEKEHKSYGRKGRK